jgi:hypothetical protein
MLDWSNDVFNIDIKNKPYSIILSEIM